MGTDVVRMVPLGTISVSDLLNAGGGILVHDTGPGEFVFGIYATYDDLESFDNGSIIICPEGKAAVADNHMTRYGLAAAGGSWIVDSPYVSYYLDGAFPITSSSLYAYLSDNQSGCIYVGSWAANTYFGYQHAILIDGEFWYAYDPVSADHGGVSGSSEPDWGNMNGGGTDPLDGDILWYKALSSPPTTGSVTFYAMVCTPG